MNSITGNDDGQTAAAPGQESIPVAPGRVAALLSGMVVFLVLMHLALMYLAHVRGHDQVFGLVRMFDMLNEGNVPTWYSSMTLMACAAVLGAIAFVRMRQRDRFRWNWLGLALLFVLLSVDEAAFIHETVQAVLRRGMRKEDSFYSLASIVYPSLLALAALLANLRFLASLPRRTAMLFLCAGAVFVGGAIGVDYVGELHKNAHGMQNMTFALMNAVEEGMEMFGVVIFLYALLDYVKTSVGPLVFGAPPAGV